MTFELIFDLSRMDSQHNKEKKGDDGEESSTESTFYGEDCNAVDVFFDDDSSMCSSVSEESLESCEYEGTYTRTFGDEDSLVLAKGRYLQEERTTVEVDEELNDSVLPSSASSSRSDDILLQAESILEGLTGSSGPNFNMVYTSASTFRLLLNRRVSGATAIDLQKGRVMIPLNRNNYVDQ